MSKAFTPIQLDKMRNLRYGMKALSLVESQIGMPLAELKMDKLTMKQTAAFIWAGLVHEDNTLTPDSVMDLIDDYSNIAEAAELLGKAIEASMGKNSPRAVAKR